MNVNELKSFIRTEVKRTIKEADTDMGPDNSPDVLNQNPSGTDGDLSPGSKFLQTPGAPFGGNMNAYSNVMLSNESRMALHDWLRFAQLAWKKYGAPSHWPNQVTNAAVALGSKFEQVVGPHRAGGPSVGYRP